MIIPLFCLNTSENLKISLPFTPLGSPHLSLSSLICLIALMVDQKKISHCQRNHPSLSQSNYKPGYFLPSAKHIADWYCMTSFSYLFYPKIRGKYTHTAVKLSGELLKDIASEVKPVEKPPFDCSLKLSSLTGSLCGKCGEKAGISILLSHL